MLAAAAIYAMWNRRRLRLAMTIAVNNPAADSPSLDLGEPLLRRAPHSAPVFERDAAELLVVLETDRAARGPAWVTGRIAGASMTLGTGLVSKPGWRWTVRAKSLRRGPVVARGWMITTSDPFGFFVHRTRCAEIELGVVYPLFASLASRHPVRELETALAAPRAGSGNELFGIREFRPGDSLRRIHWRSSARHGELIVREYEPPGVRTIRIAVDPRPPTAEVADQLARIAASEAWDCIRDGGRVVVGSVESRELWDVLDWLARYPEADFGEPATTADVVVTANPQLFDPKALRNWLVGDAEAGEEIGFERVDTAWPL